MTRRLQTRRKTGAPQHRCVMLGLGLLAVVRVSASEPTFDWQATADIAAAAESYLADRVGASSAGPAAGETTFKAGMLDSRLKLPACDSVLEAFLRPGNSIGPKTIVGVRCPGSRPWKVYVPVEIVVRKRVWVARQPLPKGHLLRKDDVVADIRDVSRMTAGYLSDQESLIGRKLRSSVLAGRILTQPLIEANNLIRRGQTVTLTVTSAGMRIRMAGKALMDGALDQRIRVENLNSGRVVEGIVRSQELVEVLVHDARHPAKSAPKVTAPLADTGYSNNDR